MTNGPRHRVAFKRMETDDEFRTRAIAAGVKAIQLAGASHQNLDNLIWYHTKDGAKLQRRIVDDVA